ncbi:hypothetical protein [Naasia lichenicola]|uniref:Uncharacterized protein n=1 Tax=Naasia lichenicola TaxID=2565933 RepID=A0A4S4FM87_9MICO|nr:hypothetical protein [Naasia lichenicola]THG31610.1 hypothetical protein E6C64_05940 [Naasia lichenicola]
MFAVTPPLRVLGSIASWLLFSLAFTLLFQVSLAVLAIGGSCASGGPYEIEVQCPAGVELFAPLSIFAGLAAVAIGLFLARGFGSALELLSWPILFVGLGLAFLFAGAQGAGGGAYLIAGLFILMGVVPLIWAIRVSALRFLLGSRSAAGVDFAAPRNGRASPFSSAAWTSSDPRTPRAADWLASLSISVLSSAIGALLALAWFGAVAHART